MPVSDKLKHIGHANLWRVECLNSNKQTLSTHRSSRKTYGSVKTLTHFGWCVLLESGNREMLVACDVPDDQR